MRCPAGRPDAARSVGVVSLAHDIDRQQQNLDVEQDRPIVDVMQVTPDTLADLFDGVRLATPSIDLRPACNARFDPVPCSVLIDNILEELACSLCGNSVRSRTYQRHVAKQYIQELRNLVQARPTQKSPNSRDPWVILYRL